MKRTLAVVLFAVPFTVSANVGSTQFNFQPADEMNSVRTGYVFTSGESDSHQYVGAYSLGNSATTNSFYLAFERGLSDSVSFESEIRYSSSSHAVIDPSGRGGDLSRRSGLEDIRFGLLGRMGSGGVVGYYGARFTFSPANSTTVSENGERTGNSFSGGHSVTPHIGVQFNPIGTWNVGLDTEISYIGRGKSENTNKQNGSSSTYVEVGSQQLSFGGTAFLETVRQKWSLGTAIGARITNHRDLSLRAYGSFLAAKDIYVTPEYIIREDGSMLEDSVMLGARYMF
jgi:hypothetical protein